MVLGLRSDRKPAPFPDKSGGQWGWWEGLRALMTGTFPQPMDSVTPNASEWSVMGIPAAWRCLNMVADAAASLPMLAYLQTPDGSEARLDPSPPVLQDPWPLISYHNWVGGVIMSMVLRGDAFALPADPDPATGYPRQAPLLNPDAVWVDVDDITGMPIYHVGDIDLGPGEIIHFRGITPPGSVRGVGVIEAHRRGLQGVLAMENYGDTAFQSSGVPSGIVTVDRPELGEKQATDLQSRWVAAFSGRRVPAVVPRSITFQPLSFSPQDMAFIESKKWSATEMCWVFGVHPMNIGAPAGSSMTYGNLEAMRSAFAQDSVMPWTTRIEQTMSKWAPRGYFVRFNFDGFLRSTTLDRYTSYVLGLDNNFLTNDEVRDLEHRPRLPKSEQQALAAQPAVDTSQGQPQPVSPPLQVVQGGG